MVNHVEIKGTVRQLAALARKLGFPYVPGDKVFRRPDGTIRAYRRP